MHPRNRHRGRYDFSAMIHACPALARFVRPTPDGEPSIDFADPMAVRMLNRALLQSQYGIRDWQFPPGYLCPPIPGRADYLHGLADLLAQCNGGQIPRGPKVRALDIGVGASAIYPLLGRVDYGWQFVAVDIDRAALDSARAILAANPDLAGEIELRQQPTLTHILKGVLRPAERVDVCLCNPPFHSSAAQAMQGSARKWQNLARSRGTAPPDRTPSQRPALNFGGQSRELWCPGGELAFVQQMIVESVALRDQVYWFSSLIAKGAHLDALYARLRQVDVQQQYTVNMAQGQKQSRFVAWSFLPPADREAWRKQRWTDI